MGAWVLVAAAAIFYTNAHGSTDFGEKINSPLTTESTRSSAVSSKDYSEERSTETRTLDVAQQVNSSEPIDIQKVTKPTNDDTKKRKQEVPHSTPSPQDPFRQHLESPYNVNSLYNTGYEYDPLAALFEATKAAYVQSSTNNFYPNPTLHFQNPITPYNNNPLSQTLYSANPPVPHSPNQHDQLYSTAPATGFHHQKPSTRFTQPSQHNILQETSFVGINNANNNNFDDYDDGSYDPYKYGDYVYFDNADDEYSNRDKHTPSKDLPTPHQNAQPFQSNKLANKNNPQQNYYYNQNHQNSNTVSTGLPSPYQHSQPFQINPSNTFSQNNNHQQSYNYYNQNYQDAKIPPAVLPSPYQHSLPFQSTQNNQFSNNNNPQQNYDYYNQNFNSQSIGLPMPIEQSKYAQTNSNSQLFNNNYQKNIAQQPLQSVFQQNNLEQQGHVKYHKPKNNAPTSFKDVSKLLDDSYSYQVEAAKQYLKEIEEAQEYARKVLAASSSPDVFRHSSQASSVNADYNNHYNNQNQFSSSTEGKNNFPLESTHYQQTARPSKQISQAVEVNSLTANINHITSKEHEGNYVEDSYNQEQPAIKLSNVPPDVPTPVPVLLPNGFLADTEEVRLAKIAHLQLVLDTLKTVSTYRSQYPKQKPNKL